MSGSARVAPHDLEVERVVLGAILIHNEALPVAGALIGPRDFYRAAHRRLFEAMVMLHGRGEAIDFVTLKAELQRLGELDEVGGPAYVAALADGVPRSANVEYYARIVKEKAMRRQLQRIAELAAQQAADPEVDLQSALERVQQGLQAVDARELRGRQLPDHVSHISEVMEEVAKALQSGPPDFIDTDWPALNSMLGGGFAPGELIFFGARPGLGKTAAALQIARRTARSGSAVFIVSREMLKLAIGMRLLAQEGPVNATALRKRELPAAVQRTADLAIEQLQALPIFITHANIDIDEIRRLVAILADEGPLGLVIVDYLQLIDAPPNIGERRLQVEYVSKGMKAMTLDHGIPVLCLSSLSRAQEHNKRPTLASLRESGNLEHDADTVILLHRPEEMQPRTEVIVPKSRNGRTGLMQMYFRGEFLQFEEMSGPPDEE